MSNCSQLFYNTTDNETLIKRITVNEDNLNFAIEKKDNLLKFLKPKLKDAIGYEVKHWIQGSYKNNTLIRPISKFNEFDIDVGIYIFCNEKDELLDAKEIKSLNRDIINEFVESEIGAKLIDSKPNCERVAYQSKFHIDIPIYYFDEKKNYTKLATENSGWIDSDPKALQDWFQTKVSKLDKVQLARLRRIIKYIKTWVMLKWNKSKEGIISSLSITVMVAKYYIDAENDEDAFINTFLIINSSLESKFVVLSPLNNDNLLDLTPEQIEIAKSKFSTLKEICCTIKKETDLFKRYLLWSSVFEHMFPSYFGTEIESSKKTNLPAISTPPEILIKKYDKNKKYLEDKIDQPILAFKKETLYFSIFNQLDYPEDAKVRWTARNNGEEASKLNDLGHSRNNTNITDRFSETCEYNGIHFMDCIIFDKYYNILGFNTVKVSINGFSRPKRNSSQKRYGPK